MGSNIFLGVALFAALLVLSTVNAAVITYEIGSSTDTTPIGVWYVTYHGSNKYARDYYLFSSEYYNIYGGYYRYYNIRNNYYYRYYNDDYDFDYYYYDDDGRRYCHYFYYDML